jgi:hypothetical protein
VIRRPRQKLKGLMHVSMSYKVSVVKLWVSNYALAVKSIVRPYKA